MLTNTSACAAEEVAQVYVARPESRINRPVKELKGFRRVPLKGGERQTFTLPLAPKFRAFHWLGIHSCGDRGRYYIDDFRIVDRDPAAEQAGNKRGEGKR